MLSAGKLPEIPYQSFRRLIVSGETTGLIDFFGGVDLTSIIGRSILIKNIEFIPRYISINNKELFFKDETGAGNDYTLFGGAVGGVRIVSANVEFVGMDLNFAINGQKIQLVEGATHFLPFDTVFKDINLYFPSKVQTMSMFIQENILRDVKLGGIGTYTQQVNLDIAIEPSRIYLSTLF